MSVMDTGRVKSFDSFAGFGCLIFVFMLVVCTIDGCMNPPKSKPKPQQTTKQK